MPAGDHGFTLIEVLIAMLLAAVISLGLAPLFALAMSLVHAARDEMVETTLAVQKIEELLAAPPGRAEVTLSPPGTLASDIPGQTERVDATGKLLGSGAGWAGAYTRRWSVSPAPSGVGLYVLRVLVTTPRRDAINRGRPDRDGQLGEVVLASLRLAAHP